MTTTTHIHKKQHTYKQEGFEYVFRHGERIVLKMACEDCGHPWWIVEALDAGLDTNMASYVERLNTRANNACLILESWEPALRRFDSERSNPLSGYTPGSGVDVAIPTAMGHQRRTAQAGRPTSDTEGGQ